MNPSVAIVGAGISGLTVAFYLRRRGIPVTVYEATSRTGGMIGTSRRDGFMVELGPNTIMTNSVAVPNLVRDLGLMSRRLLPSPSATTRYIVRNGVVLKVPMSLGGAVSTPLLSLSGKLRVLSEPFIGTSAENDESLAAFVRRRLGREFLDYLIDPFVAGVYAGDPEKLSLRHALPKMAALEEGYGSLVKGAIFGAKERKLRNAPIQGEPRMFSFDQGLGVLTDALTERMGSSLRFGCPVHAFRRDRDGAGWLLESPAGTESHRSVVFCAPAHRYPEIAAEFKGFGQVSYPPIVRLGIGFRRDQVSHPLDGFGALVPRLERRNILGALFSSSMFPNRAPKDHVLLTVFAGGARDAALMQAPREEIVRLALEDLRALLGIQGDPVFLDAVTMEQSIPQYNVGYGAVKNLIASLEQRSPGLFLAGNYSTGISVSDCISGGAAAAERVAAYSDTATAVKGEAVHV
jgi:oxygen-dependent protoporphyrinogen oxidase